MTQEDGKPDRGFTVIDRRGTQEGPGAEGPVRAGAGARPPEPPADRGEPGRRTGIPEIDFATFVLSLGTSALYHMGVAPHPAGAEEAPEPNLLLARQTIDTIEMLEVKTRGNLDPEEARLLESLLYELRMRFVESSRKGGREA